MISNLRRHSGILYDRTDTGASVVASEVAEQPFPPRLRGGILVTPNLVGCRSRMGLITNSIIGTNG